MLYQHIDLESSLNLASGWKSHPVWEFCTALNHQNPASQECKNGTFYGVDIKKVAIANTRTCLCKLYNCARNYKISR
jgi:hypothetical protein